VVWNNPTGLFVSSSACAKPFTIREFVAVEASIDLLLDIWWVVEIERFSASMV